jgi:RimJ/RimL family protein N-acetyltransferase
MELDQVIWGQGWGTRLLQFAVDWARVHPSLRWIDLGVFENNPRAIRLYKNAGFVEVGRRADFSAFTASR